MPRNPNSAPGTPDDPEPNRRNPRAAPGSPGDEPDEPGDALVPVQPADVIEAGEAPWVDPLTPAEEEYLTRAVALLGLLLIRRLLPRRPKVEWNAQARAWVLERTEQLIRDLNRGGVYAPY